MTRDAVVRAFGMRFAVALVLTVALAGCSSAGGGEAVAPQQEASTADCLTVNAESIEAIRVGVKAIQASNDVGRAEALKVADGEWFVAAEVTGPGMTPQVGVWWTQNDPTLSPSNVYNSVDGTAHQFSDYVASPFYDVASAGVDEVRSCLD
jgi:hypothetical protein